MIQSTMELHDLPEEVGEVGQGVVPFLVDGFAWKPVTAQSGAPGARHLHSCVVDRHNGKLVLFGGYAQEEPRALSGMRRENGFDVVSGVVIGGVRER